MIDAGVLRLAGVIRFAPRKKSNQMTKMVLTVLKAYECINFKDSESLGVSEKVWELYFSQLI